ncbi:MAG: hypothetical protein SX243_18675, partial [Acidobacteriota bacterium]|nr:hypothetical protein [Acidobacteriota bacterium]
MERYGQFFVEARPFQFDVSNFFRVGLGCGPVGCISLLAMVPALIVTNGLFTFMGPSAPGSGFDQFVVFLSCVLSLTFLFSIALLALRYIFVANRERERESQATTEFLRGSLVWFKERYD